MNKKKFDWEKSLESEQTYWLDNKDRICSEEWLEHVRRRTEWFLGWYENYEHLNESSRILQVGSGAEGEINFLEKGHRFAIDPLADFYRFHFGHIMKNQVQYLQGKGEDLPFKDNDFDLVITYNSLDHTENPSKTLSEISRVLKKGGILYIGVHVRSEYGHFRFERSKKHRALSDHYYGYTKRSLKKQVKECFFSILDERAETRLERTAVSRSDREGNIVKRYVKLLSGRNKRTFHLLAKRL